MFYVVQTYPKPRSGKEAIKSKHQTFLEARNEVESLNMGHDYSSFAVGIDRSGQSDIWTFYSNGVLHEPLQLEPPEVVEEISPEQSEQYKAIVRWLESVFKQHRFNKQQFREEASRRAQDLIHENVIAENEIGLMEFGELMTTDWIESFPDLEPPDISSLLNSELEAVHGIWFDIGGYFARRLKVVFYEYDEDDEDEEELLEA